MASQPITTPISIASVLSRGFSAVGGNPATFFGIAFLLGAVPSVIVSYLRLSLIAPAAPGATIALGVATMVGGLVNLLFYMIVSGAMVRATIAHDRGERAGIGECLATGLRVLLPMLGLTILMWLGLSIGFLLFFVPGVILLVWWSVSASVLVAERAGVIESLSRSRALTKGSRWRIFGLLVLLFVLVLLVSSVSGVIQVATVGVSGMANGVVSPVGMIVQALVGTISQAYLPAILTSLYIELRNVKEGASMDDLTSVFS